MNISLKFSIETENGAFNLFAQQHTFTLLEIWVEILAHIWTAKYMFFSSIKICVKDM